MTKTTGHIITPEQAITLHGIFLEHVKRSPETIAYRYFNLQQNAWLSFSKIHTGLLLSEPWPIENGLFTPTLKVKRAPVVARFVHEIKALYEGH